MAHESSLRRIATILDHLESNYGSRISVMTLCIDLALQDATNGAIDAASMIKKLIATAHLIQANHRLIVSYLQQLQSKDWHQGMQCFQAYILERLVPEGKIEWADQSILSYVTLYSNICLSQGEDQLQSLHAGLDDIFKALSKGISCSMAHAAHTIVWLAIQQCERHGRRDIAIFWCHIGLHQLFRAAGELAIAMVQRQLVMFHIADSNVEEARKIYDNIATTQRAHPRSRFILYCIGLLEDVDNDSQAYLRGIMAAVGADDQLLHACFSESEAHNKPLHSIQLLQRLADTSSTTCTLPTRLSLLKHVVIGLQNELDSDQPHCISKEEMFYRLCSALRKVDYLLENATYPGRWHHDAEWFAGFCFDAAIEHLQAWPKQHLIDLLFYARKLSWPQNEHMAGVALPIEQKKRLQDATFLEAMLYSSELQNIADITTIEDLPRTAYSSDAKPLSGDFRATMSQRIYSCFSKLESLHCNSTQDMALQQGSHLQLHALMPIAFEALLFTSAATHLRDDTPFDEMSIVRFLQIVDESQPPASTLASIANTLLLYTGCERDRLVLHDGVRVPTGVAARSLTRVVSTLTDLDIKVEEMARWLRCVVQLTVDEIQRTITNTSMESQVSFKQSLLLLDRVFKQILGFTRKGAKKQSSI